MASKMNSQDSQNQFTELPTHLSNQGEICWSQYTFVNPFESDNTDFTKSIFTTILRPHGGLFQKMDFEIEAFALEKQWWNHR